MKTIFNKSHFKASIFALISLFSLQEAIGQTKNCTGVSQWNPITIYQGTESQVVYDNKLYQVNWWTQNQRPDQNSGPWTLQGTCDAGTVTTELGLWSAIEGTTNITPTSQIAGVNIGLKLNEEPRLTTPYYKFNVKGASNFIGNTNVLSLWYSPASPATNPNPRHYLAFDNFADRTVINSAKWNSLNNSTTPPTGENLILQNLSTGNLGVGIDNPTQKLHVGGNILATGNISGGSINTTGNFATTGTASTGNLTVNGTINSTGNISTTGTLTAGGLSLSSSGTGANTRTVVSGNLKLTNTTTFNDIVYVTNAAGDIVTFPASATDARVSINGALYASRVRVATPNGTQWPDYVFEKNYKLRTLDEVSKFVLENKHLPDVPSAATIQKEGIDSAEMDAALLKKVEELTLYMIQLKEQNEKLQMQIDILNSNK